MDIFSKLLIDLVLSAAIDIAMAPPVIIPVKTIQIKQLIIQEWYE